MVDIQLPGYEVSTTQAPKKRQLISLVKDRAARKIRVESG